MRNVSRTACSLRTVLTFLLVALPASANDDLRVMKAEIEAAQIVLPAADVERLLTEAQDVEKSVYSPGFGRFLSKLSAGKLVDGARPLGYRNQAVVDIVVQAYVDVVEGERAYERSIRDGVLENVPPTAHIESDKGEIDESGLELLDALAALAESTLSEKLYDFIWEFPQPSPYRRLYVASVFPEKTLARLANATRGRMKQGVSIAPDSLFNEGSSSGTQILTALVHVADITDLNPEMAHDKRDIIVELVKQYWDRYAHPSGEYVAWRDYIAREAAMNILAKVGDQRELPLLEKLAIDVPVVSTSRRVENPQNLEMLAETVKAKLTSR